MWFLMFIYKLTKFEHGYTVAPAGIGRAGTCLLSAVTYEYEVPKTAAIRAKHNKYFMDMLLFWVCSVINIKIYF
ncbi:MAG: hypothetical protein A2487_18230 [Candidatus Raymondbacteria bacterium RifOxyC12_full_50_8]|uniref:Uncharacterized protein n=1 Tax=Candidatus Raymondbacteria bacterium RIFOXYD12_FULL_49_13 TaxID=1817890 RepID=A0A1F7F5G2_UNCRA|nr:MAG: hypothetical protein A2350_08270 [Candidatus Raymondbacteria bacterium RifOxyB12_full_50_8]OGJ87179.1 MAG: hypothetical protein A2248_04055 [Candidatus Raymondbacteria bacterium RIFOXYA2_FULL_49_16]OGJ95340.1 MAG: hypothetical protein A2487_18230 [Candidatus Raymondbacteria bacterium RifOxyC12_full_50_8]OGK01818.1 MAG: hypothetical protein A2519_03070 [Candidatus Raymondbacteria bacterium RIFOXYD12_FULL_49_13]OGP41175.1 MAG: hypothetical protein A2324_08700 [Candidatus Raymondbacteria b